MKQKIGAFFLLAGMMLIFIFWGSLGASPSSSRWLFIGILSIIWGLFLIRRGRTVSESQRFRTLRKLRGKKNAPDEE
ncbi:MAG: hypothetical protein ABFS03_08950 [Chloroflexota bacterium]